ncbi:hypothetical protein KUV85_04510 [Nocardioides panacisoli]|uniref:hypothetical protein n=1 Tax=Nocardioides panacisoli TaxID=627624 RepID=UPI001C62E9F6|nr:hypothetical protein [Nocardioides panacisoli]QYJ04956.1 hypothetical protein KUV85_04510 [Nocardioides panacisoli]
MSTEELRRRVHAATDTIDVPVPDTHDLLVRGRAARRQERRGRLVLAAVAVVVIGVAVALAVQRATQPPVADRSGYVEGSAQSLAALVIQRLDLPSDTRAVGITQGAARTSIGVDLPAEEGHPDDVPSLDASVRWVPKSFVADWTPCAGDQGRCTAVDTDRGEVELTWAPTDAPANDDFVVSGYLTVAYVDVDTQTLRDLTYRSMAIVGDPRDLELAQSVEELAGLVADERLDFETTPELAAAELESWTFSQDGTYTPGGELDLTVAGDPTKIVTRHLDASAEVEESFDGLGVELDVSAADLEPAVVSVYVEQGGAAGARCGGDPTCETWRVDGATVGLAWDDGPQAGFRLWLQDTDEYHDLIWEDPTYPGGDPRQVALPVTVDQLVALLQDLDLRSR